MKKITLLLLSVAIGALGYAQSQRLVFVEAFSQASCGPCASQNPAMNAAITAATTDTVISLKYQTSWPGVDPMNAQNPTEVATRVTYYNVTGVPSRRLDGNMGTSITGSTIRSRYPVASPYTIALSHNFSADYDSVFVTMVITCTQNDAGTLKARVALVEKEINFTTAPGSNGETTFYSVMRKMLPSAAGTTLATSWTVGQTQTLNFAVPIPSEYGLPIPGYIYNLNKLAVVAFIQDDATKNVRQAGYSAPITLPASTSDAGVTVVTAPAAISCLTSVTPVVSIKNYSASTMTSCNVNYQIDGGAVVTAPWSGSLAANATTTFTFAPTTVTTGSHTFIGYTSQPNGNYDWYLNNSRKAKKFNIIGSSSVAPLNEGFQGTAFPPTSWIVDNPDGVYPWESATTGQSSTKSARVNFFNSPAGQIDEMYAKNLDLSTTNTFAYVSFDVAYAQYTAENDKLQVMVSENCGTTWTTPYSKQGSGLATAPTTTVSFTPTSTQWRSELIDISTYVNKPNVLVKFKATSAYGNNLYVDNINIYTSSTAVSVEESTSLLNEINVYPNPIANEASIQFNLAAASPVAITMHNLLGEIVYDKNLGSTSTGDHTLKLDTQNLSNGVYFITLNAGGGKITKKVVVNK
jgi:Secretion system C-terminal sorting domain